MVTQLAILTIATLVVVSQAAPRSLPACVCPDSGQLVGTRTLSAIQCAYPHGACTWDQVLNNSSLMQLCSHNWINRTESC